MNSDDSSFQERPAKHTGSPSPMNSNESSSNTLSTAIFLLALSAVVYLAAQIGMAKRGGDTMRWQLTELDSLIGKHQEQKKLTADAVIKNEDQVKQSNQLQTSYSNLFNDIIDLAKTDADAKKIVDAFGIQRQNPEGAPAAEAKPADAKAPEKK